MSAHSFFPNDHPAGSASPPTQPLYSPVGVAQERAPGQCDVAMSSHNHGHVAPPLSPVSMGGWAYPPDVQSSTVYSPVSPTAYSSFSSPVESNTRAYALAGALQQPGAFPETSRRIGVPHAAHSSSLQATTIPAAPYTDPQQRFGALSASRMPIAEGASSSTSRHVTSPAPLRIPPSIGGEIPPSTHTAGGWGDQGFHTRGLQTQSGMSVGSSALSVVPNVTGYMSSPPPVASHAQGRAYHHAQNFSQGHATNPQNWSAQRAGQAQMQVGAMRPHVAGGSSTVHSPTPHPSQMPQTPPQPAFPLRAMFGHDPKTLSPFAGGDSSEAEFEFDSDEYGEDDEGIDPEDVGHAFDNGPPPSPPAELQFPKGLTGTPLDLLRTGVSASSSGYVLRDVEASSWEGGPSNRNFTGFASRTPPEHMHARHSPRGGEASGRSGYALQSALAQNLPDQTGNQLETPLRSGYSPADRGQPQGQEGKGKRAQGPPVDLNEAQQTVKVLIQSAPGEPPKKVKMHQCRICQKLFPRPSGLATHMNSHSGARPYKCPLALCSKTFAVRSNARRHLRTHGITVPPASLGKAGRGQAEEAFHVGFDTPVVVDVHDFGRVYADGTAGNDGAKSSADASGSKAQKLRWVPPSLSSRKNAARLRSLSPTSDMAELDADLEPEPLDSDDGMDDLASDSRLAPRQQTGRAVRQPTRGSPDFVRRVPGLRVAPAPLPPVTPSESAGDIYAKFDERNSYAEAGTYPYHPEQWRCLPGPGYEP